MWEPVDIGNGEDKQHLSALLVGSTIMAFTTRLSGLSDSRWDFTSRCDLDSFGERGPAAV